MLHKSISLNLISLLKHFRIRIKRLPGKPVRKCGDKSDGHGNEIAFISAVYPIAQIKNEWPARVQT
jgi:hypothetical protein